VKLNGSSESSIQTIEAQENKKNVVFEIEEKLRECSL
jgi:hypothetical protein